MQSDRNSFEFKVVFGICRRRCGAWRGRVRTPTIWKPSGTFQARIQDFSQGGVKKPVFGKFCAPPPFEIICEFCEFVREARKMLWSPSEKFYEGQSRIFFFINIKLLGDFLEFQTFLRLFQQLFFIFQTEARPWPLLQSSSPWIRP